MLGWSLFLRAATSVVDDLPAALRISLVPYLAVSITQVWHLHAYPGVTVVGLEPGDVLPPGYVGSAFLILLLNLVALSWIAVGWHRRVLLGELSSGWLPASEPRRIAAYLGRTVAVWLVMLLILLTVATMVIVLLAPLIGPPAEPFAWALGFLLAMTLFYRLGIVLPAGAVDRPLSMSEAMRATEGLSRPAVVMSLVLGAFWLLLQVPPLLDAAALPEAAGGLRAEDVASAGPGAVTVVYQLVIQWFLLLLGVGTLTTTYVHATTGRRG